MENQVKSKERVSEFGEVYTSKREVNAMLDLVKQETERLDSRFLEPACGDGNFLIEVLNRKLEVLVKSCKKNQYEFEKNSVVVLGSIYGIDILKDNAQVARDRLYNKYNEVYQKLFKNSINQNLMKSIKFIIESNIIHGDALTLKQVDSDKPVVFSEWGAFNNKIKRRDFTLADLISYSPFEKGTLFSDLGDEVNIPEPIKEHPLVNFDKVFESC
jgi:hypothetical protein